MKSRVLFLIVLGVLSASSSVCNGVEYQLIDLSLLSGKTGRASAINNNGQVVGDWGTGEWARFGFLYEDGVFTDLGLPELPDDNYTYVQAHSINENGQIVGSERIGTRFGYWSAITYENGTINNFIGQTLGEAMGINNIGQIVGVSDFGQTYGNRVFLYEDEIATNLGFGGVACGINNNGQIVGYLVDPWGKEAFLYADGVRKDLGMLGGSDSRAFGINDNGQIVGWSDTESGNEHAFLYDNSVMIDLVDTLLDGERSHATAINNLGQIVGYSYASNGKHAFLYDNGVMTDLGFGAAYGINDNGWIVGESVGHAVLWVPEPATLLLLGLGAVMVRRRC